MTSTAGLPSFRWNRILALVLAVSLTGCMSAPKAKTETDLGRSHLTRRTEHRLVAHLQQAEAAWDTMASATASSSARRQAEAAYNNALARCIEDWDGKMSPKRWKDGIILNDELTAYRIRIQPAPGHPKEVSPNMIDELTLASNVRSRDESPAATAPGVGVPVVGRVLRSEKVAAQYPLVPLNGGHLTLTATLEFGPKPKDIGQPREASLHFHNRLQQDRTRIGSRNSPLAANYTAAKEIALNDRFLKKFSFVGLLFPERTIESSRLYRMEIQDPQRIPVIFVHGLMSDPHIWLNAINAIYRDPKLRDNYQPWYFLYPTGLPIPTTSARLRDSLRDAVTALDPEGDDPGMRHMVLVGHSMGGVLSRMQVIEPEDALWSAFFSKRPEELSISDTALERVRATLMFQPNSNVERVVFMATPHQGSPVANRNIVRWLTNLIRLPVDSLLLGKEILTGNTDALSPRIRDWGLYAFNSVGNLSDQHPFFEGLQKPAILVPHHSIIGNANGAPLRESSDRVVPYTSSHLDTADSELVVPYWHGFVEKPEPVAEIARILHEHLTQIGR